MIQLDYFFTDKNGHTESYQLIQFSASEPWRIVLEGEYLGSVERIGKCWRQLSGEDLEETFFKGITGFIESQYFNALPLEITGRWPKLVERVVMKSDEHYLIICKQEVQFESFERIFSRYIPGLLKDEWPITFQVYDHDFSRDFSLVVSSEKSEMPAAYQSWRL